MKPSHFYFDDFILEKEKNLFKQNSYLGHELFVKNLNDYYVIPQENDGRFIIHNKNGIECFSNVCLHRQATILTGARATTNLVCPLHGWTYNTEGQLIAAPHFKECPGKHLKNYNIQNWNGMLFDKTNFDLVSHLNKMNVLNNFSFNGYEFHSRVEHECNYNWKTFIEVYLDDYHVDPFHPGLGNFVDCNNLTWQHDHKYSVQSVGVKNKLNTPGTQVYKRWHKALLNYTRGQIPEYGAIWLTIYPNIMVEWYPNVLVISTLHPITPERTKNIVEFYYPEDICHFESEFVEAHQAAYMETCYEDDEIAERMDKGRKSLYKNNTSEYGPVHDPMEKGLEYFYTYYDNKVIHFDP